MDNSTSPGSNTPPRARDELTAAEQARMVAALQQSLQDGLRLQQATAAVEAIETHISFVLVAGGFAYKFKRAINPGFLDFTTLALRRHYCHEELRLNRRLAPDLYLDVVTVHGTPDAPTLGGPGPVIDCAVRMRAFAQEGLWDRAIARGALQAQHIDELVGLLFSFHRDAAVAGADSRFGDPEQVRAPVRDSLAALDGLLQGDADHALVHSLQAWEAAAGTALEPAFIQRHREGRVRECHGDLHLGNVTQIDGKATVFDCIEFNDDFRWIDVMSDLAFMAMDLICHGRADLAHRLINAYLERGGDHGGARVLRYYIVHRALVRAKVAALRAAQPAPAVARRAANDAVRHYLDLAVATSRPPHPVLMITHGLSGSGKTTLTQGLLEAIGALRLRADIERKRLFGRLPLARGDASLNQAMYSDDATRTTYERLLERAHVVIRAGFSVILDATFLRRHQRDAARDAAMALDVPFVILDFDAELQILRARVEKRHERADDASDAGLDVLEAQRLSAEPLAPDEQAAVFRCMATTRSDDGQPQADWSPLLQRLAGPHANAPA
jgi:aminoglycoside phosphotransferase family enzyme/predicted kinase